MWFSRRYGCLGGQHYCSNTCRQMDSELAAFLDSRNPDFADTIFWPNGAIRLNPKGYLGVQSPPNSFVLAGRAIVVRGNGVLVVETPHGDHILPGGRREEGET